jgi:DNA repair exonuclease SbcCD ATPase subunit
MSESVEILISADDQASKKMIDASINIEKSSRRVESILDSLKSPADKYNEQLVELAKLQKEGAITADQFAAAQSKIEAKLKGNGNAIKDVGGQAKTASGFVGMLASMTGNSELANFAGQTAKISDEVGKLSEVSKAGGAGALAFKMGLVGLVGTLAVGIGKALGDVIFQTEKFTRAMEDAKNTSKELNDALASMRQKEFANRKEDIELIRDPEAKRAAHKQLLEELDRDINAVTRNVSKSKKEVEEWAGKWKVTGERKASEQMAKDELETDRARLVALKAQRDEIIQITSVRAAENESIRQSNEAKGKSESYLENLRQEIEYLKATKEEQIALDAARNTTEEDRGEAQRLLEERDAIIAKAEAEKLLASERQKAADAEAREAERAKQQAEQQVQRIEDIKKSEMERLEIQRIEIEQGKEAAKIKELMNKGVDEESARKIAAEEAAIDKLRENAKGEDERDVLTGKTPEAQAVKASEGRLTTRGPGEKTNELLREANIMLAKLGKLDDIDRSLKNTQPAVNFVGVA